jgi:ribosomal protein S18 acetylase RimI-like enzyme
LRVRKAEPAAARRQASWIVAIEPWRSLGYQAGPLGRWLARSARTGRAWLAVEGREPVAIVVVQPEVLLGDFIALLAVRPEAAGQGIGRSLVDDVARRTFARRRWLYASSDSSNRPAAAFYRKLGFARVGRLPDLVRPGRTEILWRLPPPQARGVAARAISAGPRPR